MILTMDMDVTTELAANARGAGMIARTERELVLTKPSAYTTWKAQQVNLNFPPFCFFLQFEFPAQTTGGDPGGVLFRRGGRAQVAAPLRRLHLLRYQHRQPG